jgi:two-component system sensor histidine kinase HydH
MLNKAKSRTLQLKESKFWAGVPPWILIGAVVILFPIVAFMTIENINRQKKNNVRLLKEKGAALIRSFEAGTRTGMMGLHWKNFQLQKLLTETAQQPDIVYLLVANRNGTILAHNDLEQIGQLYGQDLDLEEVSRFESAKWRIVSRVDGKKIFEVFREFSPTGKHMDIHRGHRMMNRLFRPYAGNQENFPQPLRIIFVGLDMTSIEEARQADIQHTLIMAAIMLLIGFSGIFLLFLAQSYRVTKTSLARIKAFSDNLVENMPIGLIAIDQDKKIASINQVAGSILRVTPREIIGKAAQHSIPDQIWQLIQDLDNQSGMLEKEIDYSLPDRTVMPLEFSATWLYDDEGSFLGYILLFKDVSEIRTLRKEITRNQRMASVGRLAAGIAHEVRNPLSSIKGFATYFKERYRDVPEDQQISTIMIQEVDRLNKVVGQLLEFARPITISKKSISIEPLIMDSLKLIERQASEKNINITTDFAAGIDDFILDPDRVSQVLLNLYLNALDSMENGGNLAVSVSTDAGKKQIEIKISDTGVGISSKDLSLIFDPYYTTKPTGTGLGLAIANNIIEAHDGVIKLDSQLGEGTTATICLPNPAESKDV